MRVRHLRLTVEGRALERDQAEVIARAAVAHAAGRLRAARAGEIGALEVADTTDDAVLAARVGAALERSGGAP